ncbi:hypothetical protein [Nostoc sp. CHAB 5715]|uniref:hypothetical protein n=1 Tax=Nostoc sp. CHAB 5715 TaxID=2780400 RepID=UPI001E4963D0|nr:hypothetical protein [Nostoc sp. CHAB 5715]MCC5625128.1 hypothetical protein [Nostoc sp. CHAB 5715]
MICCITTVGKKIVWMIAGDRFSTPLGVTLHRIHDSKPLQWGTPYFKSLERFPSTRIVETLSLQGNSMKEKT